MKSYKKHMLGHSKWAVDFKI